MVKSTGPSSSVLSASRIQGESVCSSCKQTDGGHDMSPSM